jgi:hypothetical protein
MRPPTPQQRNREIPQNAETSAASTSSSICSKPSPKRKRKATSSSAQKNQPRQSDLETIQAEINAREKRRARWRRGQRKSRATRKEEIRQRNRNWWRAHADELKAKAREHARRARDMARRFTNEKYLTQATLGGLHITTAQSLERQKYIVVYPDGRTRYETLEPPEEIKPTWKKPRPKT